MRSSFNLSNPAQKTFSVYHAYLETAACSFWAVDERRGSVFPGRSSGRLLGVVCELRCVWIFCVTVSVSDATILQRTCRKWPALSLTSLACLSVPPESLQSCKCLYASTRRMLWPDVRQRKKARLLFESSLNRVVFKVYRHFKCNLEILCLLYALLLSPDSFCSCSVLTLFDINRCFGPRDGELRLLALSLVII